MNPLFNMMVNNNMQQMLNQFNEFRRMFTGDPKQQVQQLLNSGRVSKTQYDQAVQMAKQMQQMLSGKA